MVTRPAVPPYSSTTSAMWLRSRCMSRSRASARLESGTKFAGRMTSPTEPAPAPAPRGGLPVVDGASHQVLEVDHADGVVDVLPDDGDAGVPAAQRQGQRLPHALLALDPHHLGAGHHHLAHAGVAEVEHRLDHRPLAVVDEPAGLGHVDHLAELDLGGERPLAEAAPGRDRVADEDQQGGQRAEQAREHPHGRRRRRARGRRGAGGPGCAARRRSARRTRAPRSAPRPAARARRARSAAARRTPRAPRRWPRRPRRSSRSRLRWRGRSATIAASAFEPVAPSRTRASTRARDTVDRAASAAANTPASGHQQDRRDELADQRPRHRDAPPAASSPRPTVPSRRSSARPARGRSARAAARWVRQSASSSACSPNIVRSSSGSAWS